MVIISVRLYFSIRKMLIFYISPAFVCYSSLSYLRIFKYTLKNQEEALFYIY